MFARLGSFATRFRWFIIAGWVILAVVLTLVAPNINNVGVTDQRAFLPKSAPSLDANTLVTKYFPANVSPSSAVVVVDAGKGNHADQGQPLAFVESLTKWLTSSSTPKAVDQIWSPTYGDDQTKASLLSSDKQVALVLVRFNAIGSQQITKDALAQIQQHMAAAPAGVKTYLTGDAPILAAYNGNTKGSIDSTTLITIILVIVILLLVYRSPVSPIVPLSTIGLAYIISRGVVALLGAHVLTISMYTNVFLIVVLFGAGTDYCLFLISRFREEMADDPVPAVAVRKTTRSVGETIASSAGTVIVGLATMASAELGLFNTSGPSLAIGVAIALLAALTFTPALLTLLGKRTFWPRKAQHRKEGRFWNSWSHRVVRRPVLALVIPVVILVPLAVYGLGLARDFDLLGDLPKSDATRQGFDVLSAHLGPGVMQPINFLALDAKGFDSPAGLAKLEQIQAAVAKVGDVAQVRSFTASLPDKSTLSVSSQLDTFSQAVDQGLVQLEQAVTSGSGSSALLQTAESGLLDTYGYLTQLAGAYPEVLQDRAYMQSVAALTSLAKVAGISPGTAGGSSAGGGATGSGAGGGTTTSAPAATSSTVSAQVVPALKQLAGGLSALGQSFAAKPDAQMLPAIYLKNNQGLKALHDAYVSSDGTAARFQVVLSVGPYTPQALTTVAALRQTLTTVGVSGAVEGTSAVLLDLRDASNRDMTRTIVFVLAGIFVVLLLLLRAIVAPIYLILTILLSYTATLGVVRVLFVNILGAAGLTWWVPIFMFVMLVALGMDYNIFLIGRVKEEAAKRGTKEGTQVALAKTGGIITSAGIIMAGTFAAMMSASILGLLQIGFAVAFGVLLDTFVVRTTVVPAIIVLLKRWSWWPRRGPGQVDYSDRPDA